MEDGFFCKLLIKLFIPLAAVIDGRSKSKHHFGIHLNFRHIISQQTVRLFIKPFLHQLTIFTVGGIAGKYRGIVVICNSVHGI